MGLEIRAADDGDREWIRKVIREHWSSEIVVTRGRVYHADQLEGLVAETGTGRAGLLTYRLEGGEYEITTLNSLEERRGIGTALLAAAQAAASKAGCSRIWLITTNDNARAMRFYEKLGWRKAKVHLNAMETSRRLKPEIPEIGMDGIPIRDEIEYEMLL